jgi:hypothetical protein
MHTRSLQCVTGLSAPVSIPVPSFPSLLDPFPSSIPVPPFLHPFSSIPVPPFLLDPVPCQAAQDPFKSACLLTPSILDPVPLPTDTLPGPYLPRTHHRPPSRVLRRPRLRIALSAAHDDDDVARLAKALAPLLPRTRTPSPP